MNKVCFKCKKLKPLEDFYKHPQMPDGHLNKCKECNKKDCRENRDNKLEYYRKYDRDRFNGERKKEHKLNSLIYRCKYPEKRSATHKARHAFLSGKIVKKNCENCGNSDTQMHHSDYSKPLDVIWFCKICHEEWHMEHGDNV